MADEFQPSASNFETSVPPDSLAAMKLSGGRTKPFFFYLGVNSTVPFIRLESPVASKEISWGDLVELPPGSMVNIRNTSYMQGDIQLQSGDKPVAPPSRITIPVACKFTRTDFVGPFSVTCEPLFACDTRRARRAYFCTSFVTYPILSAPPTNIVINVTGFLQQHSRNPHTITREAYIDTTTITTGIFPNVVPLGTYIDGNAMRLCDFARVDMAVDFPAGAINANETPAHFDGFYILEY